MVRPNRGSRRQRCDADAAQHQPMAIVLSSSEFPTLDSIPYDRPFRVVVTPAPETARMSVARFLRDGPGLPLVTDTVHVGEVFRAAAMSRFEAWCRTQPPAQVQRFRRSDQPDRYASPLLSGKDAFGQCLVGHRHAYY